MGTPMVILEKVINFHTFSITARDRETGAFGVAVATARPNVGSLVPWVSPRGAIATQARVNTDLGRQGLALLAQGVPVDVALSALLRKDIERDIRQVHGSTVSEPSATPGLAACRGAATSRRTSSRSPATC